MGDVQVLAVSGLPEVRAGDDLVALLAPALRGLLRDGDVLCVSSKVVSKARGLLAPPQEKEHRIAAAATRLVARRRGGSAITSLVVTRAGPVLAAAGIDASNAPDGLLLLPEDPDAEADALRRGLAEALGTRVGVVLTDTSSRIWRRGVGDIALGASGVRVLEDLRGRTDDAGRPLGVTVRGLADELAAAADLAKGKTGRVPVAIVRGVPEAVPLPAGRGESGPEAPGDDQGARVLNRTDASDWFPYPSLESVWHALGVAEDRAPVPAIEPESVTVRIERALAVACLRRSPDIADPPEAGDASLPRARLLAPEPAGAGGMDPERMPCIEVRPAGTAPAQLVEAGALAERVRTALAAEALSAPLPTLPVVIWDAAPEQT